MSNHPDTSNPRLRRSLAVLLALLVVSALAPATASAKFGVSKLRTGSSTGAENYIYTDGGTVFAQAGVDRASFYRFTVLDPSGVVRFSTSCSASLTKKTAGGLYTIQPSDPVSTTTGWRFRLEQWTNAACGGAAAKTSSLYFDVARASSFADGAGTVAQQSFGASDSAYLKVTGVGVVKTDPTNTAQNDWSVTWLPPGGATACANTAGGDRPDSAANGLLPSSGSGTLQYRPGALGDAWNRESNYDTACPAFGPGHHGNWSVRVQKDASHFVVLPAFRVDTTAPDTTLLAGPTGRTSSTSASFSFASSEPGSSFECRIDGGSWGSCTSPKEYTSLAETSHDFEVRARDEAGNVDAVPEARTWTVDLSVPAVTLTTPADQSSTSDTTPTFSGDAGTRAGDSDTVTVKVLQAGAVVATLPTTRSGDSWTVTPTNPLPEGSYTAHAVQVDGAANSGSSAEHAFTVDTTAPAVTIVDPPGGHVTPDTTPLLTGTGGTSTGDAGDVAVKLYTGFSASGAAVQTVNGTVDENGAWSVEASPALPDGTWTARAEQTDAAGNTGLSRARTFRVDSTPPDTSITSGPSNSTAATTATFRFASPEADAAFECRLDGGDWGPCGSPKAYSGLAAGSHSFEVRATDSAGNTDATPASRTWTIDTVVPELTLVNPADDSSTRDTTPTFDGSAGTQSDDSASVTLRVLRPVAGGPDQLVETRTTTRKSDGSWSVDASPALPPGSYLARAEQADTAGNVATTASHAFRVDTTAPDTSFTLAPAGATSSTTQTFRFESTEAGSSFECRLDGGAWSGCSSPTTKSSLSPGSHTFDVRAIDPAGNVDASPASASWTVDTSLPALVLEHPVDGLQTNDDTPTFSGTAGIAAGNAASVTVKVYRPVANGADTLVQTRVAPRGSDGSWSVQALPALDEGDYYAYAEQSGSSGTGVSGAHSFKVDLTAPHTSISSGPLGTTAETTASLRFGSSEPGSSFECRLDDGAWEACTSPATYTGLSDGSHSFDVRATDQAGNVDPSASSRSWIVDSAAAVVTLETPADDSLTSDSTPLFSGHASTAASDLDTVTVEIYRGVANGPDVLVQSLDTVRSSSDGSWSIAPPAPLADGSYVAYATQENDLGDVAYSAPRNFSVDTSPPDVTLTAPGNAVPLRDSTPRLNGGAGSAQGDSATVTVKLYAGSSTSGSPVQTLTATRSGGLWAIDAGALADGAYTARAQQVDAAGNTGTSATRTFRVDTTAPNTQLTAGPLGTTTSTSAKFAFGATESGSTFECRIDGGSFGPCGSPRTYSKLRVGSHAFAVRSRDAVGNVDASPATRAWKVAAPATAAPRVVPRSTPLPKLEFSLSARRKQRFRKRTRRVTVSASCSEACTLKLRGKVVLGRRSVKLRRKRFNLEAGAQRRLRLRLSRAKARRVLRALRRGKRVTVRLVGSAADSTGAATIVRLKVRLKR